jgi:hypothetical protein
MEEGRMPKKIFTQELEGTRRRGRPRKGWKDEVERDLQVLGVRRWRELATDRKKMGGYCSTGQSPQRSVMPMEEEEDIKFTKLAAARMRSAGRGVEIHALDFSVLLTLNCSGHEHRPAHILMHSAVNCERTTMYCWQLELSGLIVYQGVGIVKPYTKQWT